MICINGAAELGQAEFKLVPRGGQRLARRRVWAATAAGQDLHFLIVTAPRRPGACSAPQRVSILTVVVLRGVGHGLRAHTGGNGQVMLDWTGCHSFKM